MSSLTKVLECTIQTNDTSYESVMKDLVQDFVPGWMFTQEYVPWVGALFGSFLVGLSGVLPLLIIPIDQSCNLKHGASANKLKALLSFAVGGILGDVFLHSLPEIYSRDSQANGGRPTIWKGLWVLTGLVSFLVVEILFAVIEKAGNQCQKKKVENNNNTTEKNNKKHIAGYLNLLSNTIDNFTHGLTLGGAYLVSFRLGLFTTFAILVHEIPHEVGDFAILLRSGFSRWETALFQILTAGGGLLGAMAAILGSGASNSIEAKSSWIMPFTAGTFLHIGLVTVLPELLKEEDPKESLKQLLALILGIVLMAVITRVIE